MYIKLINKEFKNKWRIRIMTPQMIRVLVYFMTAVILKESFDFADMKKAKEIGSLIVMTVALMFIFMVYRQWQYLG